MKILLLLVTILHLEFTQQQDYRLFKNFPQETGGYNSGAGSPVYLDGGRSQTCGTDLHTCVQNFDCNARDHSGAKVCPLFFKKIGGACYYLSNDKTVRNRTRPDALKFCEDLGGNLLFIEKTEEFNELAAKIDSGLSYWTEGYYSKKETGFYKTKTEDWFWESYHIHDEINFKKVHPESAQHDEIKDPRDRLCLSINDTGIYPTTCLLSSRFVCKQGHYDNECERFKSHKCCHIPSYDYYIKNILREDTEVVRPTRECFVTYNSQTITCTKAYEALEGIPAMNFRFEKTIYYMMPANEGCGKDREAVIYSKELHTIFVRIFSLLENLNIKFRIGLRGFETTKEVKFKWSNGRYVDFYDDTFWAPGHPKSQNAICVMYLLTGEGGTYLWHSEENESICNDQRNFVICQLPIRGHDYRPNLNKEEGCGVRKSRGVLGRSFSTTNVDETNFGELPWQVAISAPSYSAESGFRFECSGILISYDSVLTSAHCTRQSGESLLVSLGDYDLMKGQKRRKLLYPEYRAVEESIIHPDYDHQIRPRKNDIAILRLKEEVNYNKFPHIGIACLPTNNIVYGDGDWECYVTGWPAPKGYQRSQILSRIEVDFTSRRNCDEAVRRLSTKQYGSYGQHGGSFQSFGQSFGQQFDRFGQSFGQQFDRFGQSQQLGIRPFARPRETEVLCVEPWDFDSTCIDDNTAMLICKKTPEYLDNPFNRDSNLYGSQGSDGLSGSHQDGFLSLSSAEEWYQGITNVVEKNIYGQDRSETDRWYLLGIALEERCDRSSNIMLFEPVHEHTAFIHTNVDLEEQ